MTRAQDRRPAPARPGLAVLLVGGLAFLGYANTLVNGFCYDDVPVILQNPIVTDDGRWADVITRDYWYAFGDSLGQRDLLYRPVAVATYRLAYALVGPVAWPQHLLNVILHSLVAMLVTLTVWRVADQDQGDPSKHLPAAFVPGVAAGMIFAVLPIHNEAVASVVGRADLLAAAGLLTALLAHRRAYFDNRTSSVARWLLAGCATSFISVGAKEAGAAVFPLIALFDLHWHRNRAEKHRPANWLRLAPARLSYLLVPAGLYLALRYHALGGQLFHGQPATRTVNILVDAPPWQHALGVMQLWGMYWAKSVWPQVLSIKYAIQTIGLSAPQVTRYAVIGGLVILAWIAATIHHRRRGNAAPLCIGIALLICYLPVSNILVLIHVYFAERLWYLPSIWAVAGVSIFLFSGTRTPGTTTRRIAPAHVVLAVAVLAFAGRLILRNLEWRDNGTLYAAAHRDQPEGIGALFLYGRWLTDRGGNDEVERGITLLKQAIEIDQGYTLAQRALGKALLRAARPAEAVQHLQIAQSQVPDPATAGILVKAIEQLGTADSGLQPLFEHARANPDDLGAQLALARRLRTVGRLDEAIEHLRDTETTFRESPEWNHEYAITLVMIGRVDDAIERYRAALALDPSAGQRAVELAMLLLERRRESDLDQAADLADRAARNMPRNPNVYICLGEIQAARGETSLAKQSFRKALNLLPADSRQRRIVAQRARTLGLQEP